MEGHLNNLGLSDDEDAKLVRRGFTAEGGRLGYGSFAIVYDGMHYEEDRVAIKEIEVQQHRMLSVIMEMFVLKKIRHKNVVRVIDFFRVKTNYLLICMEYLDGNLRQMYRDHLKDRPMPEVQAAKLYAQFGLGLAFMHNRGIAHRDLKPDNILLTVDLKVAKLADFGLSMLGYDIATGKSIKITKSSGTWLYMAPEVIHFHKNLKWYQCGTWYQSPPYCPFLADIWSMGIIVYEMLYGNMKFPFSIHFSGTKLDCDELYKRVTKVEKQAQRFRGGLHTKEFVVRHLKVKPNDRPEMDELLEDNWIFINQRIPI